MEPFVYVWSFEVREGSEAEFEAAYGPKGEWVQLFRRAPGYLFTELLRDQATRRRYVTIDRWNSRAAYDEFRDNYSIEFEELDARCAALTVSETAIGNFEWMP